MTCPTCHKLTPADSVHTCSPVPLLTASDAYDIASGIEWWGLTPQQSSRAGYALDAIASGRVACYDTAAGVFVPYMSEDDAMAMCAQNAGSANDYAINIDGYLAALRDVGAIKGDAT